MKYLTLILTAIIFSGCGVWPLKGSGGMAEHGHQMSLDKPLGPEHGLRFELDLARRHLDILVLEGAELCFPATVVQAKHRQHRITREIQGELKFDAVNDLIVQRKLLARLEHQLDYVKQHDVCVLPIVPGQKTPGDMGKRIYELLNSDNQFAFNSSELNPKYVGRLAEAAQLLRNYPGYHLRVTGHADTIGGKASNQHLSLKRAEQVSRYLQILGLPAERIQSAAVGSDSPLFKSKQAHNRLVNRRVSIELIEMSNSIPVKPE